MSAASVHSPSLTAAWRTMSSLLRGFSGGGITRAPPKPSQQSQSQAWMSVPVLEAMLRAEVQASNVEASIGYFEQLMRRQRTPHAQVCVGLLQLCVTQAPRQALWVLEQMSYDRGLEVDDYTRIVRLFIMQRVETEKLSKFQEIGCEICTFHDEGMHEYFTSMSTLLNLELHEAVTAGGMKSEDDLSVSLITHKRQVDAIALLCKKGGMVTPLFPIVMAGMGGREGAQSPEEVKQLACADTGLSPPEAVEAARAVLAALKLNPSQERAVEAALTQRLTLVQGPPGTGKTRVACEMIKLWVRALLTMACYTYSMAYCGLLWLSVADSTRYGFPRPRCASWEYVCMHICIYVYRCASWASRRCSSWRTPTSPSTTSAPSSPPTAWASCAAAGPPQP